MYEFIITCDIEGKNNLKLFLTLRCVANAASINTTNPPEANKTYWSSFTTNINAKVNFKMPTISRN